MRSDFCPSPSKHAADGFTVYEPIFAGTPREPIVGRISHLHQEYRLISFLVLLTRHTWRHGFFAAPDIPINAQRSGTPRIDEISESTSRQTFKPSRMVPTFEGHKSTLWYNSLKTGSNKLRSFAEQKQKKNANLVKYA